MDERLNEKEIAKHMLDCLSPGFLDLQFSNGISSPISLKEIIKSLLTKIDELEKQKRKLKELLDRCGVEPQMLIDKDLLQHFKRKCGELEIYIKQEKEKYEYEIRKITEWKDEGFALAEKNKLDLQNAIQLKNAFLQLQSKLKKAEKVIESAKEIRTQLNFIPENIYMYEKQRKRAITENKELKQFDQALKEYEGGKCYKI